MLDTDVVSELRRGRTGRADRNVVAWAGTVDPGTLFLSAVTVLELEVGVRLAERRDAAQGAALRAWMDGSVLPAFRGRVLPVDAAVALRCAALHVPDRRPDRGDLIAATALVHAMIVVTRNGPDFEGTGARVIDPWRAPAR